jgi:hypothetical protein
MDALDFNATDEVHMMSADNRSMSLVPKIDKNGDAVVDLLPRVRYRIRMDNIVTDQQPQAHLCFERGILVVPEKTGEHAIVVNISDRIASITKPIHACRRWTTTTQEDGEEEGSSSSAAPSSPAVLLSSS